MMMLLRALLVFTSYRTPENSELNSIKLIDSRAAFVLLWNNIFSSLVHEIAFCSFEASLKMMHRWIYASTLACIATCNSRQWIILWIGFQLSVVSLQRRLVKWKLNEVFHLRNWFFVNLSFSESNFSTFSILHLRCDAACLRCKANCIYEIEVHARSESNAGFCFNPIIFLLKILVQLHKRKLPTNKMAFYNVQQHKAGLLSYCCCCFPASVFNGQFMCSCIVGYCNDISDLWIINMSNASMGLNWEWWNICSPCCAKRRSLLARIVLSCK